MKCYACCFMGNLGWIQLDGFPFNMGIPAIARRLRKIGCEADVFPYTGYLAAEKAVYFKYRDGYKTVGIGYSAGVSSLTDIQQYVHFDLIVALAASSLTNLWPINHNLCKRSVLWHGLGFDPMSNAGESLGFDVVHQINAPHLWIDLAPEVTTNILDEVHKLQ